MKTGAGTPLAQWVIEFDGTQVQDGINLMDKMKAAMTDNQKAMASYRDAMLNLSYNYSLLYNKTMGWVQAGMQGTAQANQLAVGMQFLSREIANIFTPTINAVINSVHSLVDRFRKLTGEQQDTARNTIMMSLGFLGAVTVFNAVKTHVDGLAKAFRVLFLGNPILAIVSSFAALLMATEDGRAAIMDFAEAFKPVAVAIADIMQAFAPIAQVVADVFGDIAQIVGMVTSKMGTFIAYIVLAVGAIKLLGIQMAAFNAISWANPFVLIAAAAAGIFAAVSAMKFLTDDTAKPKKERQELQFAGGGFEAVEQTWIRLQTQINKQDYAKTQTELLGEIERNTRREGRSTRVGGLAVAAMKESPPWLIYTAIDRISRLFDDD